MGKAKRPRTAGKINSKKIVDASGLKKGQKSLPERKGRIIPEASVNSDKFDTSLKKIVAQPGFNKMAKTISIMDKRHISCEESFNLREVLIEGYKNLKAKGKEKITASHWLGECFQVIVDKHPLIREFIKIMFVRYVKEMNAHLRFNKSGIIIYNGHREKVDVKSEFIDLLSIQNVWLKEPGQTRGKESFDMGKLILNKHGQALPGRVETKTRASGKEMPEQQVNFEERLKKCPEGTKLTYDIEGKAQGGEIDIKDLVFIKDKRGNPLEEEFFSRIGVISGKKAKVTKAKDKKGHYYIRIKVSMDTDSIRGAIEKMLRDTNWQ